MPTTTRTLLALILAAVAVCAWPLAASAQQARRDLGVHFAGQTVANPRGALSIATNPAGLSALDDWELRLQAALGGGQVGGGAGSGWGAFGSGAFGSLRLGAALEHRSDEDADALMLSRLSLAGAWRLGDRFALGYAARLLGGAAGDGGSLWSHDVGLLLRPWSWISLGWRATGLGDPGAAGADGSAAFTTRYAWGLALRPFAGSDRFTVAFDVDWPAGGTIGSTTFSMAGRIASGLSLLLEHRNVTHRIGASRQTEQRTSLLLDIGLGHWGAELGLRADSSLRDGSGGGVQVGARLSGDVPPSFVDPGPSAVIIPLAAATAESPAGKDSFAALLLRLEALVRDPAVQTVVFRFDQASFTWAQVEELRAAIAALRAAGKRTAAYASSLGTRGYMVACATEKIGMPAAGSLTARGIGADFVGLATALARVGITVQTVRYDVYKSAPETFTRERISPALNETLSRVVRKRYGQFLEAVALGRSLTPTAVEDALAQGVAIPEDAQRATLIDVVATPKEFEASLRDWGMTEKGESLAVYAPPVARRKRFGPRPRLAVLALAGSIVDGEGGRSLMGRQIGGRSVAKQLGVLAKRSDIKGVVVRVDSGGGAVYGSELIYQGLRQLSARKPTAISMASVAASGGYWLSLGADKIFADAATVTGSIGIFTLKPEFSGTLALLGIGVDHVAAGPGTTVFDPKQPWSATEEAVLRRTLGRYYALFLERVKLRRKLSDEALERLAGGRIHLGRRALERGLVDSEGGLLEALRDVRSRAGLQDDDDTEVVLLPRPGLRLSLGVGLGAAVRSLLGDAVAEDRTQDGVAAGAAATAAVGRALLHAAGPWLDHAAVLTALPAGTPLALSPLPRDVPAP